MSQDMRAGLLNGGYVCVFFTLQLYQVALIHHLFMSSKTDAVSFTIKVHSNFVCLLMAMFGFWMRLQALWPNITEISFTVGSQFRNLKDLQNKSNKQACMFSSSEQAVCFLLLQFENVQHKVIRQRSRKPSLDSVRNCLPLHCSPSWVHMVLNAPHFLSHWKKWYTLPGNNAQNHIVSQTELWSFSLVFVLLVWLSCFCLEMRKIISGTLLSLSVEVWYSICLKPSWIEIYARMWRWKVKNGREKEGGKKVND